MSLKPVIVMLETLPVGLKANFAAILGMSLGRLHPELVGTDTPTADGIVLSGITRVPLPVLGASEAGLRNIFLEAEKLPVRLAYMRAAFEANDYEDYAHRIATDSLADHGPQALLLAGPRKAVDRLCGRLPLLR